MYGVQLAYSVPYRAGWDGRRDDPGRRQISELIDSSLAARPHTFSFIGRWTEAALPNMVRRPGNPCEVCEAQL